MQHPIYLILYILLNGLHGWKCCIRFLSFLSCLSSCWSILVPILSLLPFFNFLHSLFFIQRVLLLTLLVIFGILTWYSSTATSCGLKNVFVYTFWWIFQFLQVKDDCIFCFSHTLLRNSNLSVAKIGGAFLLLFLKL